MHIIMEYVCVSWSFNQSHFLCRSYNTAISSEKLHCRVLIITLQFNIVILPKFTSVISKHCGSLTLYKDSILIGRTAGSRYRKQLSLEWVGDWQGQLGPVAAVILFIMHLEFRVHLFIHCSSANRWR